MQMCAAVRRCDALVPTCTPNRSVNVQGATITADYSPTCTCPPTCPSALRPESRRRVMAEMGESLLIHHRRGLRQAEVNGSSPTADPFAGMTPELREFFT